MSSVKQVFEETIQTDHKIITEEAAKSILKKYGIKVPGFALVKSADEAAKAAKKLGYPLVMKVVSPQILHKTDVGGVKVGVTNVADVKKTFNDMYGRLSKKKGVNVKGILKKYGVKVPGFALAKSVDEAAKQAKKLGFPLVMKVVSPQILHKTDVGGVKVGVENVADVKKTFNDMYGRLSKKKGVDVKGILLEKMVPKGGVELIVGIQNDPQFGPMIMAGLGGASTADSFWS